jgi:hypothetical protein
MKLKRQKKHKKMRSIKKLIRRTFDLTTYFSFQRTICNPKCAIFQGGVISLSAKVGKSRPPMMIRDYLK